MFDRKIRFSGRIFVFSILILGMLASKAYLPMLFKDGFGGSYDSALYLQNLDAANTANLTIKLYDASGNLACTITDTLSALASKGYWLPGLLCPP